MSQEHVRTQNLEHASAPATHTRAYDPDATEPADFPEGATLFLGTGGDVCIQGLRDPEGTKTVFKNLPNGYTLPVMVRTVYGTADGTTAADIVAIW